MGAFPINCEMCIRDSSTIDALQEKGIKMEQYGDMGNGATQDDKGVLRGLAANMGPDIALSLIHI